MVFAPTADEMYPEGFASNVRVGGALTESFEGASRPSHFDGVAVIVTKLLGVMQPDELFLGEKGTHSSSPSSAASCATSTCPSRSRACRRCASRTGSP